MNCVRKHLSAIKGGRLAARVRAGARREPAGERRARRLAAIIGSGPTVPDPTTCADALAVLDRYAIAISPAGPGAARERRARDAQARRRGLRRPRGAPHRDAAAVARGGRRAGARRRHRGAHPRRRDRGRIARGRQGPCGAGAADRAARPAVRAAVRRAVGRRDDGDREAQARGPRRPRPANSCSAAPSRCRASPRSVLAADTDGIDGSRENAGAFVTPSTPGAGAAPRPVAARPSRPQRRLLASSPALGDLRRAPARRSPTSTTSGRS